MEALLCGHLFHSECIQRYCDSSGRSKANACPLKCGNSTNSFFGPATARQSARSSNENPSPADDEDMINNEVAAQIVEDTTRSEEVSSPVVN